jgi:hypothetical protein
MTHNKAIALYINRNFLRQNWQVFKEKFKLGGGILFNSLNINWGFENKNNCSEYSGQPPMFFSSSYSSTLQDHVRVCDIVAVTMKILCSEMWRRVVHEMATTLITVTVRWQM